MKTFLIILAVIVVLAVIAYFLIPKFRKWILGIAVSLAVIGTVVVEPEIPIDPIDDTIEVVDSVDVEQPDIPVIDSIEVYPVYTYKEIIETIEIPFQTFDTQVKSRAQKGEKGIREITYKLTFNKGQQIKKEKIKEKIKKHPKPQINYEPEITYKEITETESIPFTTSTTNVSEEARSGENGVLTITYKITYSDGEQIAKEKLSEVITRQPRSEIVYEAPEPEPIQNVYEIKLIEGEDNTDRLQSQLDEIPNGTAEQWVTVNFPKGRFNIEGNNLDRYKNYATRIDKKEYWIINAYGTELYVNKPSIPFGGNINQGNYSHRRQFQIYQSNHITVNGLEVTGANFLDGGEYGVSADTPIWWESPEPDYAAVKGSGGYVSYWEFEHNFHSEQSTNITFNECIGKNPFGDAYYIHGGNNIKILNSKGFHVGRQLVATASVSELLIDNFYGEGGRRTGIDLETDYTEQVISNIEIKNSYIQCQFGFIAAGGPGAVNDVWIHDNKFDAGKNSVYCRSNSLRVRRENWTYENNERLNYYGGTDPALKFGYTDNVIVRNNIDSSYRYFVGNIHFKNMTITGNTVSKGHVVRVADFKEGTLQVDESVEVQDNTNVLSEDQLKYKN